MIIEGLICWKCGATLEDLPQPLARLAECLACRAELHVCRLCEFYDTQVALQCRETIADEVKEKERANFCDYFQPRPGAYSPEDNSASRQSVDKLTSLFDADDNVDPGEAGSTKSLDDLFK